MSFKKVFVFFLFSVLAVSSCTLEKARPSARQHVIIASDCLFPKDTSLFGQFIKDRSIRVFIHHLSADSIEQTLKHQGVNTHFDMVLLKSVYDIAHFEKLGFFQRIPKTEIPIEILPQFRIKSNKWIAFGVDPYIIVSNQDSLEKIASYSAFFKRMDWRTDLTTNAQFVPLYASLLNHGIQQKQVKSWLKQHLDHTRLLHENDSTFTENYLLTNFSTFQMLKHRNKSPFKKSQLIVPENQHPGTMYNLHCLGIVKQARNYFNALQCMHALVSESMNYRVTNQLKIESIYEPVNPVFKSVYTQKKETNYQTCLPYFGILNQLVSSLKND